MNSIDHELHARQYVLQQALARQREAMSLKLAHERLTAQGREYPRSSTMRLLASATGPNMQNLAPALMILRGVLALLSVLAVVSQLRSAASMVGRLTGFAAGPPAIERRRRP